MSQTSQHTTPYYVTHYTTHYTRYITHYVTHYVILHHTTSHYVTHYTTHYTRYITHYVTPYVTHYVILHHTTSHYVTHYVTHLRHLLRRMYGAVLGHTWPVHMTGRLPPVYGNEWDGSTRLRSLNAPISPSIGQLSAGAMTKVDSLLLLGHGVMGCGH